MPIRISIVIVLSLITLLVYNKSKEKTLFVHLMTGFSDSEVKLYINNENILSDTVSTDPSIGMASWYEVDIQKGEVLKIKVVNKIKNFEIKLKEINSKYVEVWLYKDSLNYELLDKVDKLR